MKTIKNIAEKYLIMLSMVVYLFTSVSSMFFVPKRNLSVYTNKQTDRFLHLNSGANFTLVHNAAKHNLPLFQHAFKSVTEKKRNSLSLLLFGVTISSIIFGAGLSALKNKKESSFKSVLIPNQAAYISFCSFRL